MKNVKNRKLTSMLLCMMLIVAMALTSVGCGGKNQDAKNESSVVAQSEVSVEASAVVEGEATVLGEGNIKFTLAVVDQDGNETDFQILTDKETVGEALLDVDLIAGDESEYGLYVKTVNGVTADYDKDKTYWAFYVNGEYANTGVDSTPVEDGAVYSFRIEK
jgi:hypothetical protein